MAELSLQHLEKVYDNNVQAVYDFNLDVKDGELIVLVGPSGCGKYNHAVGTKSGKQSILSEGSVSRDEAKGMSPS